MFAFDIVIVLFLYEFISHNTCTSAFLKLQEKDQAKLRERIEWMFSQADRANQLNQLAIEGGGKDGIKEIDSANPKAIESDQKLLAIGYSKGEGKVSDSKVIAKLDENPDKEKVRIPQMQICTSEAKNSLFFQPEDNYVPVLTLDEIEDRVGKDKEIKRANTRLPTEFYTEFMKDRSQKKIVHEINLTEEQLKDGHNYKGSTPIVHGYKLVKKMGRDVEDMQQNQKFDPVLAMHKLKNFLEKGESDEKSGGFKIPKSSTREQLSHQMVHQAESRKKREQKAKDKKRLETLQRVAGTPSRAKKGYDGLSDAAKRLASSVRGGSGLRQSILRSSTRKGGITDKVTPNVLKR